MSEMKTLRYPMKEQSEVNRSYIPFIANGGIFVPSTDRYKMGEPLKLILILPDGAIEHPVDGKVVWLTPKNALYNIYPGVGVQFVGEGARSAHELIKKHLSDSADVGAYAYGLMTEEKKSKK